MPRAPGDLGSSAHTLRAGSPGAALGEAGPLAVKEDDTVSEQEARQRLARLAELGLITATLAHEQRQPLFAVKAIAQLLERQVEGSAVGLVGQLLDQVEHLERLVDGVGLYARAPDGELQPLDLNGSVRAAADLMRHRGQRRGVQLRVERSSGLPAARADVATCGDQPGARRSAR